MASVLITVPKYVTISPNPAQQQKLIAGSKITNKIEFQTSSSTKDAINQIDSELSSNSTGRGKKRRLDHLTWEEKIQRKKLKNRVAAQTSRDRKKQKMDDMEQTIKKLTEQTEILHNKCETLQSINQSLLEKNRKLDQQVEDLQKQLDELKYNKKDFFELNNDQQNNYDNVNASDCNVGFNYQSSSFRSAEGKNGIKVNNTRRQQKQINGDNSFVVEDNCSLSSLQDLFEDFDSKRLEELAESLLADITTDMENDNTRSCYTNAESTSGEEQLFGSMVGTTTKSMEPDKDSSSRSIKDNNINDVCSSFKLSSSIKSPAATPSLSVSTKEKCNNNTFFNKINDTEPETVYGNYDEKNDCITIVMDNNSGLTIGEVVEEIICEEEKDSQENEKLKVDEIENDDPIKEFLCLKNTNTTTKSKDYLFKNSPLHTYSDLGYESIGSPQSEHSGILTDDDILNNTLYDLFPSLA